MFEGSAAYLDRHGLLLPGEKKRLPKGALGEHKSLTAILDTEAGPHES